MYAKVNGAVAYPYTDQDLRRDHPDTSFPATMDDATRAEWGMVPVAPTPVPAGKVSTAVIATLVGGVWVEAHTLEDRVVDPEFVVRERARRLAMGFDYDFGDGRGVHRIGQTAADLAGWSEVTTAAQTAINLGSTTPIGIVTDTGPVAVTPLEWQSILAAATAYRQPIWAASFALQAMLPIPTDFADDSYWP
jgi:hypothetical protein